MIRFFVFVTTLLLLLLTVPWFFSGGSELEWFGFPAWAVYAVGANCLFPVGVALLIKFFWADLAGGAKGPRDRS